MKIIFWLLELNFSDITFLVHILEIYCLLHFLDSDGADWIPYDSRDVRTWPVIVPPHHPGAGARTIDTNVVCFPIRHRLLVSYQRRTNGEVFLPSSFHDQSFLRATLTESGQLMTDFVTVYIRYRDLMLNSAARSYSAQGFLSRVDLPQTLRSIAR